MPDYYSQLLEWRRQEAAARGLSKLSLEFYSSTASYLADLKRTVDRERAEGDVGRKYDLARQTLQRSSQVARDIVDARTSKVLNAAFQASVGGARDLPNSLREERAVFDELLKVLEGHRGRTAPFLSGPAVAAPVPPASAPAEGQGKPVAPTPHATSAPTGVTVRMVQAGRPIQVGDERIDLRKEDVLTLPPETARLLVDGGLAVRVERSETPPTT